MGRRADLRVDDKMAAPRARLRVAHRCLASHDPCRNGRQSQPPKRLSVNFKTLSAKGTPGRPFQHSMRLRGEVLPNLLVHREFHECPSSRSLPKNHRPCI